MADSYYRLIDIERGDENIEVEHLKKIETTSDFDWGVINAQLMESDMFWNKGKSNGFDRGVGSDRTVEFIDSYNGIPDARQVLLEIPPLFLKVPNFSSVKDFNPTLIVYRHKYAKSKKTKTKDGITIDLSIPSGFYHEKLEDSIENGRLSEIPITGKFGQLSEFKQEGYFKTMSGVFFPKGLPKYYSEKRRNNGIPDSIGGYSRIVFGVKIRIEFEGKFYFTDFIKKFKISTFNGKPQIPSNDEKFDATYFSFLSYRGY